MPTFEVAWGQLPSAVEAPCWAGLGETWPKGNINKVSCSLTEDLPLPLSGPGTFVVSSQTQSGSLRCDTRGLPEGRHASDFQQCSCFCVTINI